ncbi:MAG: terpene synthase family protein [Gammaproteobacteria bacterium]
MSIETNTLPDFFCPFPPAVSPYAEAVHNHTLEWSGQHRLVTDAQAFERLRAAQFIGLVARAYPNAPLDRLRLVSDWITWLFILDDECDEHGIGKRPERLATLHGGCLKVLAGYRLKEPDPRGLSCPVSEQRRARKDRPDLALLRALRDICERLRAFMPHDWMMRFALGVADYFEACEWEARNRAQGIWPDPAVYMQMRPYTGALYPLLDLIEMTEGTVLPLSVRKHPLLQDLIGITSNVVCWSNDVFSLEKERAHHDLHNLVLILQQHEGLSLQEAVDRVIELTDAQVRRFIELEARLPRFGTPFDAAVRRFVGVLHAWMRGNLDWSCESGRYRPAIGTVA